MPPARGLSQTLGVKSRLLVDPFDEQIGLFSLPCLQGLNGGSMFQSALRNMVVVGRQIQRQCGLQVACRRETRLLDQVADAPVEALDHAVRLGMARRAQAMFDAQGDATHVEGVAARGDPVLAGETVRELAAVVGEHLLNSHRGGLLEATKKVGAAGLGLVAVDAKEHPARGPVDGHEQVAPMGLIGHLWQVLDVDVQEAGLIVFEGLERGGLAFHHRLKALQVRDPVAAQAPVQTRAGNVGIDEFTRHRQQVVQRQQHHAPQLDNQHFLGRRQRRMQRVRTVRAVLRISTAFPLSGRRHGDVVLVGQLCQRCLGGMDFSACAGRCAGSRMDLAQGRCSRLNESMTSRINSRALNKGQLRTGT